MAMSLFLISTPLTRATTGSFGSAARAEPVAVEELSFEQPETAGMMKNPSAANAAYVFQRGRGAVLIGGQAKGVFREVMARSLNDERRPAAKRRTVAQSGPLCNGEYRRKLTIP